MFYIFIFIRYKKWMNEKKLLLYWKYFVCNYIMVIWLINDMLYFLFKDCVLYGRKWRLISSSIVVILLVMFISIDIDLIFYDLYENSKLVIFRK